MAPLHQLADYFREREGFEILGDDKCFAIYKIMGDTCYIRDIWVHPDFRRQRVATELANEISAIALEKGCKRLTGSVSTTAHNPTLDTQNLIGYGMKIISAAPGGILFGKDL